MSFISCEDGKMNQGIIVDTRDQGGIISSFNKDMR